MTAAARDEPEVTDIDAEEAPDADAAAETPDAPQPIELTEAALEAL